MGEEAAAAMAAEQKQRKEQGAKWCGCRLAPPLPKFWRSSAAASCSS